MVKFLALALILAFSAAAPAGLAARAQNDGETGMDRVKIAEENLEKLFGAATASGLALSDPELVAIRDRLIYGEIAAKNSLDEKRREIAALAALAAIQAPAALRTHTVAALNAGLTSVEIKETIYQTAPYIGFPRVDAALEIINVIFEEKGIKLPLASQGTVSEGTRLKDGVAVQSGIFGVDHIQAMRENAPVGQKELIANYLSAYCFGDFYTRKGLSVKTRELVTFCAIVALGGCDPQAKAHAAANVRMGNSKQNLVDALCVMLPYIGFPRALNGLAAVNAAVPEE